MGYRQQLRQLKSLLDLNPNQKLNNDVIVYDSCLYIQMTYAFTCSRYSQLTLTCDTCHICDVCFKPLITSTGASCTNNVPSALKKTALKVLFTHLHDHMQPNMGTSVQKYRVAIYRPRSNMTNRPNLSYPQLYSLIFENLVFGPIRLQTNWLL